MTIKAGDFTSVEVERITSIPKISGTYRIITNSWWATDADGKILKYKGRYCLFNKDKRTMDYLIKTKEDGDPSSGVIFIEAAFLPADT